MKDHLGNVRVTVSDRKFTSNQAENLTATSYLPFGMIEPNMFALGEHRWGYNGTHENDNEVAGNGNHLDFGGYGYDPRVARRWNVEPLASKYPSISSYIIFGNNPIYFADLDGNDLTIRGKNKSSITFTTDLVNLDIDASSLGVNFGGSYILEGNKVLSAALDIAGYFDPSGAADGANTILLAKNKDYWGATISAAGAILPYLGDAPKLTRLGKNVEVIDEAIDATKNRVKLREGTKKLIRENAPKTKDGRFIDANTGKPIEKGQEVFGHKSGEEWSKYKKDPANQGKTRKEVIEDQNNPNIYQIEDKKSNASHKFEEKPKKTK